ncbi:peptide chain release factor 2 [Patescibacteria group bacterium]|nr:peptide chain release factor 2 [Patescibacteria group bacterium]
MEEILSQIKAFQKRLGDLAIILNLPKLKAEIVGLGLDTEDQGFWQDQAKAKETLKKIEFYKKEISGFENLKTELGELEELVGLIKETPDKDLEKDIKKRFVSVQKEFQAFEFKTLFKEKYDPSSAIMAIHAGAGGSDAQDWAEILTRMYLRFFEKMGFRAKIIDESKGKEAGIKSAVIDVSGSYAYGYLRSEAGVHRLVRISPFNADALRHTSFALVEVLPEIGEIAEVKIDPKDLKIDTFKSSGPGGQYVNKTESAIRLTHIPSGLAVASQSERSQAQNREVAMKILRAKLHQKYLEDRQAEKKKIRGEFKSAEWGNQIRSYVLHPYKMVKDHRTGYETSNAERVLDGDIIDFIESYLRKSGKK